MIQPAPPGHADTPVVERSWSHETHVIVSTCRALLRAESRGEAAALLQAAIGHLGGEVIPAREAEAADLPVDVSLGVGEPLGVRLPDNESSAQFLIAHVGSVVEDALWAARRSDRHQREAALATEDTVSKVVSREEIAHLVDASVPGDAVCVLDLDTDKLLDDAQGVLAGETVLREFGALLLASTRRDDVVGRSAEDGFVVLLRDTPTEGACRRMRFIANKWVISGRHGIGVSAGIATVDPRGSAVTLRAADTAMNRAKSSGRGLVELAGSDDYTEVHA